MTSRLTGTFGPKDRPLVIDLHELRMQTDVNHGVLVPANAASAFAASSIPVAIAWAAPRPGLQVSWRH